MACRSRLARARSYRVGAGVGVPGGLLNVAQGNTGVERSGDEGMTQGVRSDLIADAGAAGDSSNNAAGGVAVEGASVAADQAIGARSPRRSSAQIEA